MGLLGLLPVLAFFILLGGVQEPELVEGFFGKRCPRTRVPCIYREIDQCTRSKPCPGKMKCCNFNCAKKCLDLKEDICSLPMDIGLCLARIPRWWYNKEIKSCSRFSYGGCSGNNNNFQSRAVCRAICPDI
ncbi:WAP four-disulfide core domain protein 6A-like [Ailuropoda melanoleuca]|uniref:WAP four-disulfide core domain protein 6A-like n=1 Tax=Ailuropoda melanoleuca TaxID=9646 RepID=UPI0009481FD4|nr:WAP four-disulfide core domain protein 6A-like [Ailuropoda melanoleuca]